MQRLLTHLCVALLVCLVAGSAEAKKAHRRPHAGHARPTKRPAARPIPQAPAKVATEDIEEIETVEPEPPENKSPAKDGSSATEQGNRPHGFVEWLSRLHAAMVHLPIAWTMLLCMFDIATFLAGRTELRRAGLYLAILALCSCLPAAISGLLRLDHLPQDPSVLAPAIVHRNIMYVSSAMLTAIVALRTMRRNELQGIYCTVYMSLVVLVTVLVAVGAHLGGALVYGDDFLPFF